MDEVSKLGKKLGLTRQGTDAALRRHMPLAPTIERSKDVFDGGSPFEMQFKVEPYHKGKFLDLNFQKPPSCLGGDWTVKCENFEFTGGGDHLIQLQGSYEVDGISVYINNILIPPSSIDQVDPVGGVLYVQGGIGYQQIVVCYIYSCNCVISVSKFWDLVHSYNDFGSNVEDAANITDGNPDTESSFGACMLFPEENGCYGRGWEISFRCKQLVSKIEMRKHLDGIYHYPENVWVDGSLVPVTIISEFAPTTPDHTFGWQEIRLSEPVYAGTLRVGTNCLN